MKIGEFVREKRELRGMSVRGLGIAAGVSHTEIHRIENGERLNPSASALTSISQALGVSSLDIFIIAGYLNDSKDKRVMVEKAFPELKTKSQQKVLEKIANILMLNPELTDDDYEKITMQVEMFVDYVAKQIS